jgi:signal peptidase II
MSRAENPHRFAKPHRLSLKGGEFRNSLPCEATLSPKDTRNVFWIVLGASIILDQLVKGWTKLVFADGNLANLHSRPWPGVFEITMTDNKGIAFGLLQGHGVLLAPVAILMSAGAMWYSYRHPRDPALAQVAMGLLAAGALGNLIDRVFFGKVTDMFYFRLINFPVFNVADACITVAAGLLIYLWTLEAVAKPKPATDAPADAA